MQMNRKPAGAARRPGKAGAKDCGKKSGSACSPLPDLKSVASATECTGMLPSLPPDKKPEN